MYEYTRAETSVYNSGLADDDALDGSANCSPGALSWWPLTSGKNTLASNLFMNAASYLANMSPAGTIGRTFNHAT